MDRLDATLAVADRGRIIARGSRTSLLARLPGHAVIDFDGPAPALAAPNAAVEIHRPDSRLSITAVDAGAALGALRAGHPDAAAHVRSIEMHPPTLDDLYRDLVTR